jgi:hypothetical protein
LFLLVILFYSFFFFVFYFSDDLELLYITPALPVPVQNSSLASRTPRTKLRMERIVLPSKFMLPPYNRVTSTDEQELLYQQVIKHNSDSEHSKIKEYVIFFMFTQ